MATHFGTIKRSKPGLRFVKGQDGQQAKRLQETHPIADGEEILSGMLISKTYVSANSRYEWVAGLVSGAVPFLADQDFDDGDVLGSGGLLTGYPLSSEIEVQIPFARLTADNASDNTTNWDDGAALAGVARNPASAQAATDGYVKLAQTGDQIIAYLSGGRHINGLIDTASENTHVTKDADGKVLVAQLTGNYSKGNLAA